MKQEHIYLANFINAVEEGILEFQAGSLISIKTNYDIEYRGHDIEKIILYFEFWGGNVIPIPNYNQKLSFGQSITTWDKLDEIIRRKIQLLMENPEESGFYKVLNRKFFIILKNL